MEQYIALRLMRYIQSKPDVVWDWQRLSTHKDLTPEVIDVYIDKPWDWFTISARVPLWIVKKHMDRPWNWTQLSISDYTSALDIAEHPNLPWDISYIGFTSVTQDEIPFLRVFKNRLTYFDWVDHTEHATWKTIKTNMDLPWKASVIQFRMGDVRDEHDIRALDRFPIDELDWQTLSRISDYSVIHAHPELPWIMTEVAKNPTVPYPAPVHLDIYEVPIESEYSARQRWIAASIIRKHWYTCTTDPSYKICRTLVCKFITSFTGEIELKNAESLQLLLP